MLASEFCGASAAGRGAMACGAAFGFDGTVGAVALTVGAVAFLGMRAILHVPGARRKPLFSAGICRKNNYPAGACGTVRAQDPSSSEVRSPSLAAQAVPKWPFNSFLDYHARIDRKSVV